MNHARVGADGRFDTRSMAELIHGQNGLADLIRGRNALWQIPYTASGRFDTRSWRGAWHHEAPIPDAIAGGEPGAVPFGRHRVRGIRATGQGTDQRPSLETERATLWTPGRPPAREFSYPSRQHW